MGIGPMPLAWEANVLPLYYTRILNKISAGIYPCENKGIKNNRNVQYGRDCHARVRAHNDRMILSLFKKILPPF